MDFALETACPRAALDALFVPQRAVLRRGGAPAPVDVLLERHAEESRDDARAGDERATQRA
jgi:hypothetical protein